MELQQEYRWAKKKELLKKNGLTCLWTSMKIKINIDKLFMGYSFSSQYIFFEHWVCHSCDGREKQYHWNLFCFSFSFSSRTIFKYQGLKKIEMNKTLSSGLFFFCTQGVNRNTKKRHTWSPTYSKIKPKSYCYVSGKRLYKMLSPTGGGVQKDRLGASPVGKSIS